MNWDAVGAIAESLGALGVMATLVYVAAQIRQSERTARASLRHSNMMHGLQVNLASGHPETAPVMLKGTMDFSSLTPIERVQFMQHLRAGFAWYEEVLYQSRTGGVEPGYWTERAQTTLRSLLQLPGVVEWWRSDQSWFTEEFRNEVDRLLAD